VIDWVVEFSTHTTQEYW